MSLIDVWHTGFLQTGLVLYSQLIYLSLLPILPARRGDVWRENIYVENKRWRIFPLSCSSSEQGGNYQDKMSSLKMVLSSSSGKH